jgi:hypothetical protein
MIGKLLTLRVLLVSFPYAISSPTIISAEVNGTVNQSGSSGLSVNSTVVHPEEIATSQSGNYKVIVVSNVSGLKVLPNTGGCHVQAYKETFSYSRCLSKTRLVRGCQGSCTSYFIPLLSDKRSSQQKCKCCKVSTQRKGRVTLSCPGDPVLKKRRIPVWGAKTCQCRPCSSFRKISFASLL